ncbi:MAG: aldehyde dehydrogenase family protein [Pseudomonadota bacterium]
MYTNGTDYTTRFANGLRAGMLNLWEVPAYRMEFTPLGGIRDWGLGYKEGVQEAVQSFCNDKTLVMPRD